MGFLIVMYQDPCVVFNKDNLVLVYDFQVQKVVCEIFVCWEYTSVCFVSYVEDKEGD